MLACVAFSNLCSETIAHLMFACLLACLLACLPSGTVQTMGKLVKAPEKRVAAVMTLCALVQRCK